MACARHVLAVLGTRDRDVLCRLAEGSLRTTAFPLPLPRVAQSLRRPSSRAPASVRVAVGALRCSDDTIEAGSLVAERETRDADDDGCSRSLISFGADLAGALGGVGATVFVGPFAGGAIGVAVSRSVKAIGQLAVGEKARVGAALGLIEHDAQRRKADGEEPRRDGFFDDRGMLRPEAVDLLEGVLREAAAAYEERKVPLLARLFSETAHRESVSGAEALYFVRLTSALTYRQLVILSAYAAAPDDIGGANGIDPEVDDLGERHLLGIVDDDGVPRAPGRFSGRVDGGTAARASATAEETASEAARSALALTPTGAALVELTGAAEVIPDADRADWLATTR